MAPWVVGLAVWLALPHPATAARRGPCPLGGRAFALGCAVLVLVPVPGRGAGADAVTFNKDVGPILFQKCASCHRPNNVGPFPLLTYQDARKRDKQLARVTAARTMPPWMPHPEWGESQTARTLTDEQVGVLKASVEAGTPEDDGARGVAGCLDQCQPAALGDPASEAAENGSTGTRAPFGNDRDHGVI